MNMKSIFAVLAAAASMAVSCEKPSETITPGSTDPVNPPASLTGEADITFATSLTKTALGTPVGEDVPVVWEADDKLIVWDGVKNQEFSIDSDNFTAGSSSAVFKGRADVSAEKYYVVHTSGTPEFKANTSNGTETDELAAYNVVVPAVQHPVKGSYDPDAVVSAGVVEHTAGSTDHLALTMKNICALLKVTLTKENITSVSVKAKESKKYLAATGRVVYKNDGTLVMYAMSGQSESVAMEQMNGAFEPGDYYIAVTPRVFADMEVTYTDSEGNTATTSATGSYTFKAGSIIPLGIDDSKLEFSGSTPVTPSELVLTVDCASQPFTENIATSSSAYVKESKTWYLEQDGVQYPFVIDCGEKGYRYVSNSIRLNEGGATKGSIKTPAIENMKLVSVYVTVTNGASDTGKEVYIYSALKDVTSTYENYLEMQAFAKNPDQVSERTFELNGTSANKSYYVVARYNKTQIAKLVLTYQSVTK